MASNLKCLSQSNSDPQARKSKNNLVGLEVGLAPESPLCKRLAVGRYQLTFYFNVKYKKLDFKGFCTSVDHQCILVFNLKATIKYCIQKKDSKLSAMINIY